MNMNEIEKEIARLEEAETNWDNCEKLHILYAIRQKQAVPEKRYSYARSEFTQIASEVPFEHLMDVLDEHMEAIQLVYPKEYKLIIRKLKNYE